MTDIKTLVIGGGQICNVPAAWGQLKQKCGLLTRGGIAKGQSSCTFTKVKLPIGTDAIVAANRLQVPSLRSGARSNPKREAGSIDHFPTLTTPAFPIGNHWFNFSMLQFRNRHLTACPVDKRHRYVYLKSIFYQSHLFRKSCLLVLVVPFRELR